MRILSLILTILGSEWGFGGGGERSRGGGGGRYLNPDEEQILLEYRNKILREERSTLRLDTDVECQECEETNVRRVSESNTSDESVIVIECLEDDCGAQTTLHFRRTDKVAYELEQ